jgi:putative transposase
VHQRIEIVKTQRGELSIAETCRLLKVSRSSVYYQSALPEDEVWLMNLIRDIWLQYPFYGYRKITQELKVVHQQGVNHKRVLRLMQKMEIQALYCKPNTSRKEKGAFIYPYLLKKLIINSVNQVWMIDITYLRLESKFFYLVAFIDVFSRYVTGWHLSPSLDTQSCLIALNKALKIASPDIINSDQGCQFTSTDWKEALDEHHIKISMTGKGRCLDNIYIERLWRTIKYEAIYLDEYDDFKALEKGINVFIQFYNEQRYHQALNYLRPADLYYAKETIPHNTRGCQNESLVL